MKNSTFLLILILMASYFYVDYIEKDYLLCRDLGYTKIECGDPWFIKTIH
jgi:hypothetical protein